MMAFLGSSKANQAPDGDVPVSGNSLLDALIMVAGHHGLPLTPAQVMREHRVVPERFSVAQLVDLARALGLRASTRRMTWTELTKIPKKLPAIALLRNGDAMVVREVLPGAKPPRVVLNDPTASADAPLILDETRFTAAWTGVVLLIRGHYLLEDG